ncbi:transposable element Tc3 transposase [Trichonephila clavipes]|nr:transposable element Tc3 transposase [Trichonephila clavipes]
MARVWGGIILGSRTDLHVQSVTMTGHIYRDVILEQHVRLFRGAMGAEFLFMNDNARPHRANIVDECLQSEDITRMDWPAYSPGLNPIEHVWDMLGRRIVARQPPPTCLPELRRALLDEWCNIAQDQIDNLILNMPRRFAKFGISLQSWKWRMELVDKSENGLCNKSPNLEVIVRVQYFVRGGFVGYRSHASSKHLSPHLPVDELDSSGVKKGLRCRCKMHVWVSGPQRNRLDVDVWRSDVTTRFLVFRVDFTLTSQRARYLKFGP